MAMPGFDYEAPEQSPVRSWLYDVATVKNVTGTGPERVLEGARVWPRNCGPTGTWPSDPCEVIPEGTTKGGDRPGPSDLFDPVTVWAWDECGMGEDEAAVQARALHLLDLNESAIVESAFATRLVADAGAAVSSATGFRTSAAQLAQSLRCAGLRGVIHADMPQIAMGMVEGLVSDSGALTLRPFGTPLATGCYQPLGDLLVATGQVFVWRSEATVRFEFNRTNNVKMALAERTVLVAYEPCLIEAREALPPTGGGGGGVVGSGGLVYPSP